MTHIFTKIRNRFNRHIFLPLYHSVYLKRKVRSMRKKETIRVLYVLQLLPQWKTENLYIAMLNHPRFEPIIGIAPITDYSDAEKPLKKYIVGKGYDHVILDGEKRIIEQGNYDIIIYQRPYPTDHVYSHQIEHNWKVPSIYIHYALHTLNSGWDINQLSHFYFWQEYFENESIKNSRSLIHYFNGNNYVVTGLPMMDELTRPKEDFEDPWPKNHKKRIIYAPHHTIYEDHAPGINYSTFIEYSDTIIELAKKYSDKAYFIFKPHPLLYDRLVQHWGKERTDNYYNQWRNSGFSDIALGPYLGLFKHSDAIIHDCASFTIEYLYTLNPCMYLVRDEQHTDNLNEMAKEAFSLYYHGHNTTDIELFIQNVINEVDPLRESRQRFYDTSLRPPYGKTACDNIIHAILGTDEYSSQPI